MADELDRRLRQRRRTPSPTGRTLTVSVRLTAVEYDIVADAALGVGAAVAAFVADSAVAFALHPELPTYRSRLEESLSELRRSQSDLQEKLLKTYGSDLLAKPLREAYDAISGAISAIADLQNAYTNQNLWRRPFRP